MARSALALVVVALSSCATTFRPFATREPMWVDRLDMRELHEKPESTYSNYAAELIDYGILRPVARVFAVDPGGEAVNVNSVDEVPTSSWFVNRAGHRPLSPRQVATGPCEGVPPIDSDGQWTVLSGSTGKQPGFVVRGPRGRRYLVKMDKSHQPEQSTSAEVVVSRLIWAAGYYVPCNRIAFLPPDALRIAPGATYLEEGHEHPLTRSWLEETLSRSHRLPDGRHRLMASQFIEGEVVGPWRYQGTREDDANDVVPHEDRRELRGFYVLASWVGHFDVRDQNTLATWVDPDGDGRGHLRHYLIDFGAAFGLMAPGPVASKRRGYTHFLDVPDVLADFFTLGTVPRPWYELEVGPTGPILGYYEADVYEPEDFHTNVPNPAFARATERDHAWMTRKIAHIRPSHVRAAVGAAHIRNDLVRDELVRVLLARREKILRRWFRNLSPLSHPRVEVTQSGSRLCLRDLAVSTGLLDWERRPYWTRAWWWKEGDRFAGVPRPRLVRVPPDRICTELPEPPSDPESRYLIVDVAALWDRQDDRSLPARVHLYRAQSTGYVLVGLERPYDHDPPG